MFYFDIVICVIYLFTRYRLSCTVCYVFLFVDFFFFKQKTAYEMRISDWSSDVRSSDLAIVSRKPQAEPWDRSIAGSYTPNFQGSETANDLADGPAAPIPASLINRGKNIYQELKKRGFNDVQCAACLGVWRSEEHTSELQSLMRISYAVFCLKKKK